MAGTLEISDELCWMPAGWVYDHVLEDVAAELQKDSPALAHMLLQSTTEKNGGYLDLRSASRDELLTIELAAERAYARVTWATAASFAAPEFYEGFISQFRALREMLRARLQGAAGMSRTDS